MANEIANDENDGFTGLYRGNLIPLHVVREPLPPPLPAGTFEIG